MVDSTKEKENGADDVRIVYEKYGIAQQTQPSPIMPDSKLEDFTLQSKWPTRFKDCEITMSSRTQ